MNGVPTKPRKRIWIESDLEVNGTINIRVHNSISLEEHMRFRALIPIHEIYWKAKEFDVITYLGKRD